jgi:cation transporter-like permease
MALWKTLLYKPCAFDMLIQIKYVWGALGLLLCAVPVFFNIPGSQGSSLGSRTQSTAPSYPH